MKLGLLLDGKWSHNFLNQINREKFKICFVIGRIKLDTKNLQKKKNTFFYKKKYQFKKNIKFYERK